MIQTPYNVLLTRATFKIENYIDSGTHPLAPFQNMYAHDFMFLGMIAGGMRSDFRFRMFFQFIFHIDIRLANDDIVQFEMEQMRIDEVCNFDGKVLAFHGPRHFFPSEKSYLWCAKIKNKCRLLKMSDYSLVCLGFYCSLANYTCWTECTPNVCLAPIRWTVKNQTENRIENTLCTWWYNAQMMLFA